MGLRVWKVAMEDMEKEKATSPKSIYVSLGVGKDILKGRSERRERGCNFVLYRRLNFVQN
jgi:hypothetical protein